MAGPQLQNKMTPKLSVFDFAGGYATQTRDSSFRHTLPKPIRWHRPNVSVALLLVEHISYPDTRRALFQGESRAIKCPQM